MSKIGNLLVAPPNIDNWWEKSVIVVLEENQYGNTGIILNKQSNLSISKLGEKLGVDIDIPGMVYVGGPVSITNLGMIHSNEWRCSNTTTINEHFSISSSKDVLDRLSNDDTPEYWRLFIGMCAWSDTKLKTELNDNRWHLADSFTDLLFDYDADEQWDMAIDQSANYFSKSILPGYNN